MPKVPKKQSYKAGDVPVTKKAPKSQSKFVPRKEAMAPKAGTASLTIPRTKPVLSGPNAGQG